MANAHDALTLSVYVGSYGHSSGKGGDGRRNRDDTFAVNSGTLALAH